MGPTAGPRAAMVCYWSEKEMEMRREERMRMQSESAQCYLETEQSPLGGGKKTSQKIAEASSGFLGKCNRATKCVHITVFPDLRLSMS